jgi:hypothetical protein
MMGDTFGPHLPARRSPDRLDEAEAYFAESSATISQRLEAFPRFVDRSSIGHFLVLYELVKLASGVHGSIIECGVYDGAGVFGMAHASSLIEPLNHRRRVIGFDTFSGLASVTDRDTTSNYDHAREGAIRGSARAEIERAIGIFDQGRPLAQIPKIHLIEGDFMTTGPEFVRDNPHMIVSLMHLDFDVYEPTAKALELFLPLMPAGAVLAFDEAHAVEWPGETQALLKHLDLPRLRLQRFPFTSISYAVLTGEECIGDRTVD